MREIAERDELAHEPGASLHWAETTSFAFYDPAHGLGCLCRMEARPNEGAVEVGLHVVLPDGGFIAARHVEPHAAGGADLEVGDVRLRRLEPLRRWRLEYDGPAHSIASAADAGRPPAWQKSRLERLIVELDFEGMHPPAELALAGDGFAQAGSFRGTIWVSGDEYAIAAAGWRGRAWGEDDGCEPRMARRFFVHVAPDVTIVAARASLGGADVHRGWIDRGGRSVALEHVGIATTTDPDSYLQRRVRLRLRDADARTHVVDGEIALVVPLPRTRGGRTTVACEGFGRFSYDGRTGHGTAEYLHRLDAEGTPIVRVE